MPIQRSGPTPPYFEYITNSGLVPQASASPALTNLVIAPFSWVEIPRFQRGISWSIDDIENFLASNSVLLGNVVLGNFKNNGAHAYIPPNADYCVLVDGLQRLAVGTMLLSILDPLVLHPSPSRATEAPFFQPLAVRVHPLAVVYQHNDQVFLSHTREIIRRQYTELRKQLEEWIDGQFASGQGKQLADQVLHTMLVKQIATDIYFNFSGPVAIMNAFLGLNTIRVDLGPVDFLRAHLVEQATVSGWSAALIEDMENDFSSVFTRDEKAKPELLPFVSIVLSVLARDPTKVLSSWGPALQPGEVDNFLEFIGELERFTGHGYFDEIRASGAIPFAALLAHYYRRYLTTNSKPSFLAGGKTEDPELHEFLLASYRALLDGRISRTRQFAEKILNGVIDLTAAAQQISTLFLNISTTQPVDLGWLTGALNRADNQKSRRIFNAMLLPQRSLGLGTSPFIPLRFGRKATDYHIDHLIPKTMVTSNAAGEGETDSLRNFAPLPSNQNRVAKATSCSTKLAANGIYANYVATPPGGFAHPYCQWLLTQAQLAGQLDAQGLLVPNAAPKIGDDRLVQIATVLLDRL